MANKEGKYCVLSSEILEKYNADGVILIVAGQGCSGFSIASRTEDGLKHCIPELLRALANEVESQVKEKHQPIHVIFSDYLKT